MTLSSLDTFHELSIELTHKCALTCVYCSSSADINRTGEIDIDRVKEIIIEVKRVFGVDTISLSGGETLLYSHFSDLYRFLSSEGLQIIIYTSGVRFNPNGDMVPISSDFLRSLYLDQGNPKFILNVQGHNKALIEEINGVNGSFEIIEESIDNIISENLLLGAHVVPFKKNFWYLAQIVEYCRSRSFTEVSFLRFVPQGRGLGEDFLNSRLEFGEINAAMRDILRRNEHDANKMDIRLGHPINFLFLTGDQDVYRKEEMHYCRGGLDAPLILPNGNVSMCPAWKNLTEFSAGNIYWQDFSEIWDSHYFRVFREFIGSGYRQLCEPCRSCEHLEICRGKCVAQRLLAQRRRSKDETLESMVTSAPDPQCFKGVMDD